MLKQREDSRVLHKRLDEERRRLTALLQEWPVERRRADLTGYATALRDHYTTCEEIKD